MPSPALYLHVYVCNISLKQDSALNTFVVKLVVTWDTSSLYSPGPHLPLQGPILDYGSIMWDPHQNKQKLMLEKIQLFATHMAAKEWHNQPETLDTQFNLSSCARRHYFKMLYFLSLLITLFSVLVCLYKTLTLTYVCLITNSSFCTYFCLF